MGAVPIYPFLLDVLDLFAKFFDFNFDFDGRLTDADAKFIQAGSLREDCRYLAVHFLEEEVHPLTGFVLEVLEPAELIEMNLQAGGLLGNITPLGIQQRLRFKPMSALSDQLRCEVRDTRDQLLAVMIDEV